ncbi:MAG: DUF5610 domain-containing protein [Pseudomonadota bacterium]
MINIGKPAEQNNIPFDHSVTHQRAATKSLQNNNGAVNSIDLSSGILSVDQTQKILQQELASKLEERFQLEGIELKGLNADDFTPDKVAGRILSFIELGISRAGDDEEKTHMLEQAREGVEQGFKDARDILEAIGVLEGKVKEDIDKTYDLIQAGLNRLENPDSVEKEQDKNLQAINQAALSTTSSEENRKTSVEITTRDGDIVTIDLERKQSESSASFYANNGNQSIYGASYSSSSYTSIEYQVKGDLDDGEKAAIDDLLAQLNDVAKDFYQGDIEKAFNKAKEVGFDAAELANFSVDMSYQKTSQVAVSAYQNIQHNNQQDNTGQGDEHQNQSAFINDVANFMHNVDELMKHDAFNFLDDTDNSIAKLLNASLELQDEKDSKEPKESSNQSLNEMIEALHNRTQKPE